MAKVAGARFPTFIGKESSLKLSTRKGEKSSKVLLFQASAMTSTAALINLLEKDSSNNPALHLICDVHDLLNQPLFEDADNLPEASIPIKNKAKSPLKNKRSTKKLKTMHTPIVKKEAIKQEYLKVVSLYILNLVIISTNI